MTKYRVKPGYTFGAFGTYREGDIVELPEADAQGFLDKLQPVPADLPSAPPEETPADLPGVTEDVTEEAPPAGALPDTESTPDVPAAKVPAARRPTAAKPKPANG